MDKEDDDQNSAQVEQVVSKSVDKEDDDLNSAQVEQVDSKSENGQKIEDGEIKTICGRDELLSVTDEDKSLKLQTNLHPNLATKRKKKHPNFDTRVVADECGLKFAVIRNSKFEFLITDESKLKLGLLEVTGVMKKSEGHFMERKEDEVPLVPGMRVNCEGLADEFVLIATGFQNFNDASIVVKQLEEMGRSTRLTKFGKGYSRFSSRPLRTIYTTRFATQKRSLRTKLGDSTLQPFNPSASTPKRLTKNFNIKKRKVPWKKTLLSDILELRLDFQQKGSMDDVEILKKFFNILPFFARTYLNGDMMELKPNDLSGLLFNVTALKSKIEEKVMYKKTQKIQASTSKAVPPTYKQEIPLSEGYDPAYPGYNGEILPEWNITENENPDITKQNTIIQEIVTSYQKAKLKQRTSFANITILPIPDFKNHYDEDEFIQVDAFFMIKFSSLKTAVQSLFAGTKNPKKLDSQFVLRTLTLVHPILNHTKVSNYREGNNDPYSRLFIKPAKTYIRKCLTNFCLNHVPNLWEVIIKDGVTNESLGSQFRNSVRDISDRRSSAVTDGIKGIISQNCRRKVPAAFEKNFDSKQEFQQSPEIYLDVSNKDWIVGLDSY